MNAFYLPIGLTVLATTTWFITRRKLPPDEELLCKLRPDTLKGLDNYLPYRPIRGLVESDRDFWRISDKYRGLLVRAANALVFIRLCQNLERKQGMPRQAVRCIFIKALWQWLFSVGALLEEFARLFIWSMPHICARTATHFYWELSNRAEALNAQFGTESWMAHV